MGPIRATVEFSNPIKTFDFGMAIADSIRSSGAVSVRHRTAPETGQGRVTTMQRPAPPDRLASPTPETPTPAATRDLDDRIAAINPDVWLAACLAVVVMPWLSKLI